VGEDSGTTENERMVWARDDRREERESPLTRFKKKKEIEREGGGGGSPKDLHG
jgi:hypothetical protein